MQKDMELTTETSLASDDDALALRQTLASLQVRDKGDVVLERRPEVQQWKSRHLQRMAEELKAEWQEAQLQQIKDLERLYLARLLGGIARQAIGHEHDLEGPIHQRARSPRGREKHKTAFREGRCHREEPYRQQAWHHKSGKKTVCPERRGTSRPRGLSPPEKNKGKRAPSSKTSSSRRSVSSRLSRAMDLAKLSPLLAPVEEIEGLEEEEMEPARDGRRQVGRGTPHFMQDLKYNWRDHSPEGKLNDLEELWPVSNPDRRSPTPPGSLFKCDEKNKWQKDLEFAFEELFNTNRKLKRHLNLHLEQRPRADQNTDEEQGFSETQGQSSDISRLELPRVMEAVPTGESESAAEAEAAEMSSKTSLESLLIKTENLKCHQMAKPMLKNESQILSEAGISTDEEDLLLQVPKSAHEPSRLATLMEEPRLTTLMEEPRLTKLMEEPRLATLMEEPRLAKLMEEPRLATLMEEPRLATLLEEPSQPYAQKHEERTGWMALRQKQKAEMEQRRQKTLSGQMEHPDMSLEIHYKAELEEERRERRRTRLAILKAYPNGLHTRGGGSDYRITSFSGSSLLNEERHKQMIHDLQQQISEQNKLHKQFLEKARKRLEDFQKTC
ncbi:protein DDC8 homolog [Castor canadensis]|uniref:Protein DDC8 homolog n=1 Tax=Castor canadensis TaxID=51338 RepID=A0AC58K844_CASCN